MVSNSPATRGRGYKWMVEMTSEHGVDWFTTLYQRINNLESGAFTHEGDRRVANALSAVSPPDAEVTEMTVRNFRLNHDLRSFSKRTTRVIASSNQEAIKDALSKLDETRTTLLALLQ
jgi:hypothetical protein